ncbi:hypothetical protein JKP88DRAFT_337069 [Tribonema minus]|uniref:Glucose-methanol-choline oxidoreductase N-terminal domain-containing protein n=1 Tax=Tribonema minus TaxID=303371 RepID=A0A836C947_9STRA|nr:hypothetical protein JKP88DRAFT_337069 [Tribonema minus]
MPRAAPAAYDFVVVGAGTAGSILAQKLATAPQKYSVLLLEGGPRTDVASAAVPQRIIQAINTPGLVRNVCPTGAAGCALDWGFTNVRGAPLRFAKHTGGNGAINGAQYHRAWISADLPFIASNEGPDGELGGGFGMAPNTFNISPRARRATTYAECVVPLLAKKASNFKLITNAYVTKIDFEQKGQAKPRATAVRYLNSSGKEVTVNVRKEVILAAGAIMSPTILLKSGVGPPAHLQDIGVPVVADNAHVGSNLRDHLSVGLNFKFKHGNETYLDAVLDPTRAKLNQELYKKLMLRSEPCCAQAKGPLTTTGLPYTVHMRYPGYMSGGKGGFIPDGPNIDITFRPWRRPEDGAKAKCVYPCTGFDVTISLTQLEGAGGSVQLASRGAAAKPRIAFSSLTAEADKRVLYQAYVRIRQVMQQQALASRTVDITPGPPITSYEQFAKKKVTGGGSHAFGSCALGTALDARLRVKGLANVRVADASVMPQISVRPQASVMLVGSVAADLALQDARAR